MSWNIFLFIVITLISLAGLFYVFNLLLTYLDKLFHDQQ